MTDSIDSVTVQHAFPQAEVRVMGAQERRGAERELTDQLGWLKQNGSVVVVEGVNQCLIQTLKDQGISHFTFNPNGYVFGEAFPNQKSNVYEVQGTSDGEPISELAVKAIKYFQKPPENPEIVETAQGYSCDSGHGSVEVKIVSGEGCYTLKYDCSGPDPNDPGGEIKTNRDSITVDNISEEGARTVARELTRTIAEEMNPHPRQGPLLK